MGRRDTFPFEQDRWVIESFLLGKPRSDAQSDYMHIENNRLLFQNRVIAWYDTAGALIANPIPEIAFVMAYANRVIHCILECLGVDEIITREVEEFDHSPPVEPGARGRTIRYFLADQEFKPGAPVILAGPLTIQAYRASKNPRPS